MAKSRTPPESSKVPANAGIRGILHATPAERLRFQFPSADIVGRTNKPHSQENRVHVATLTWHDGDSLHWADLPASGAATVGRRSDANIVVANDTVSRLHFIVRPSSDGFAIENLSQSTDTRVLGKAIAASVLLKDGDPIQAGAVSFHLHDLARSAGHQEVACSHCQRGNGLERRECWYCGTSMVNAPTAGFKIARPWGRLAGEDAFVTLYNGQSAFLAKGGGLEAGSASQESAVFELTGKSGPSVPSEAPGNPQVSGRPFKGTAPHGTIVEVAGRSYVVLTRA